jgi:hypothetical protein
MIDGRGSGNRQHNRRPIKKPSQRELSYRRLVLAGRKIQGTTRASQVTGRHRSPRNKSEIVFFAVIQYVFVFAIREIVPVLNAYDRDNLLRMFDFSYRNFGKTDMSNLALVLEFLESAQRFLGRNFWIGTMQLVEIDTLQLSDEGSFLHIAGCTQAVRPVPTDRDPVGSNRLLLQ